MHIYICPYCDPCATAHLTTVKAKNISCKYNKEDDCEKIHKCKEVMKCKKCKNEFIPNKKFIADQKRKIKDG
jgi:hypothetical protein